MTTGYSTHSPSPAQRAQKKRPRRAARAKVRFGSGPIADYALPAQVTIAVDGNGGARSRAQLGAVLDAVEFVRDIPVRGATRDRLAVLDDVRLAMLVGKQVAHPGNDCPRELERTNLLLLHPATLLGRSAHGARRDHAGLEDLVGRVYGHNGRRLLHDHRRLLVDHGRPLV